MLPTSWGPGELIIILVVVLLLFGAKRIPELAKGLGTGMKEFKKGASGEDEEIEGKKDKEKQDDEDDIQKEEKVGPRAEDSTADTTDHNSSEAEHAEQQRS